MCSLLATEMADSYSYRGGKKSSKTSASKDGSRTEMRINPSNELSKLGKDWGWGFVSQRSGGLELWVWEVLPCKPGGFCCMGGPSGDQDPQ